MINLSLLDICDRCPNFEATSNLTYTIETLDFSEPMYEVTCKHIEKCNVMYDYVKKEVKKNGN